MTLALLGAGPQALTPPSPPADTATLDPATLSPSGELSNGNLTLAGTNTSTGVLVAATATNGAGSGKKYFEITFDAISQHSSSAGVVNGIRNWADDEYPGDPGTPPSLGIWADGSIYFNDSSVVNWLAGSASDGDTLGIAVDLGAGAVWVRTNAGWSNGGNEAANPDPAAGIDPLLILDASMVGTLYPAASAKCSRSAAPTVHEQVTLNFGGTSYIYGLPAGFDNW